MAWHKADKKMTVAEAKAYYKYAQPSAIFLDGSRLPYKDMKKADGATFEGMEVSSGIVYYYAKSN